MACSADHGARHIGRQFYLWYGDGSSAVGGSAYEVDMRLGSMVAKDMTIGAAELPKCRGGLARGFPLDGILGLGLDGGASGRTMSSSFI